MLHSDDDVRKAIGCLQEARELLRDFDFAGSHFPVLQENDRKTIERKLNAVQRWLELNGNGELTHATSHR